jgi:hypothetical protein
MTMVMHWNGANTKDLPASYGAAVKVNTRAVPVPLTNVGSADKL